MASVGDFSGSSARVPLVGRAREMQELCAGLDEVLAGRGRLFIISGEPGIGKSRLADEFSSAAAQRGVRAVWGRCWEADGSPPYWPWIQILRSCGSSTAFAQHAIPAGGARLLARLVPEFEPAAQGAVSQPASLDSPARVRQPNESEAERFLLFDAVASFLRSLSLEVPLLVILDDVHAADEASLLLLRAVARQLRQMRVFLFVTYRDAEAQGSALLSDLLGDLGREGTTVSLRGFSEAQVTEFVRLASGAQPDSKVVRMLYDTTEGNPFFLTEVVRLLASEGRLIPGELTRAGNLTVPHSVRVAIRRRLILVPDATKEILRIASVAGREFELAVIRAALDLSTEQLFSALESASVWGLINPMPGSIARYRFSHALISETLYEDLSGMNRKQYHLLLAETIARLRREEIESCFPELAHHYFAALPLAEGDKAVTYSELAAVSSLRQLAYERAVEFYQMALDALALHDPSDPRRRCQLLLGLGEAECRARHFDRFRKTFQSAAAIARGINDGELLARAVLGYGMLLSDPNRSDPATVGMLEEALASIGPSDSVMRARLLARLAEEIRWSAQERATTIIDEAIGIVRKHQDPSTLVEALYVKLHLIRRPDNAEERLALTTEMARMTERCGLENWAFDTHYHRGVVLLELGDMAEYRREIEAIRALPQALRLQNIGSEVIDSMLALIEGRVEESDRLAEAALEIGRVRPNSTARQLYGVQIILIRREQGRLNEVEPLGRRSLKSRSIAYVRAMAALHACETNRRAEASEAFEELAHHNFSGIQYDFRWYGTLACLAESCAFLGDKVRAETLYQMLAPYEFRNAAVGLYAYQGPVAYHRGLLAVTVENYDEAEKHYRTALQLSSTAGARVWLARSKTSYAAMLLARRSESDRERAHDLLDSAILTADEFGLKAIGDRAIALKQGSAGSGSSTEEAGSPSVSATVRNSETEEYLFRKEGDFWTICQGKDLVRVKDVKGLEYIALLLRHPNQEIHALDLVAGEVGLSSEVRANMTDEETASGTGALAQDCLSRAQNNDAGEMLDMEAKADYRRRLVQLDEELDEAREMHNAEQVDKIQEEIDALGRELKRAFGLGGRDRRAASSAERARINVKRAIKAAIERINEHNPDMGRFFASSIRTGTFCTYAPALRSLVRWQF